MHVHFELRALETFLTVLTVGMKFPNCFCFLNVICFYSIQMHMPLELNDFFFSFNNTQRIVK